ncbi:hypothetical protein BAY61_10715 [Prauserella marina]|uniref:Uncharacterized protein n=1 Tax=Prauserella marina TaxID=530584 RepID=A0A222VNU6_9PSEU|nr:hypothetical protein [Prauserella marina]ASR35391.1 hypothetical protein BAY61_10715 [Prauserella marina]PWV84809.1 hypothetical protein DES30_101827 [Prauserella marina]SDC12593.1 hypothetical protein SAMN05421630_101509 [Prauserella marina]
MSRTSGSDGPENVDATFEEIVADLRAQGFGETAAGDFDVDVDSGRQDDPDLADPSEPAPGRPGQGITTQADTKEPPATRTGGDTIDPPETATAQDNWRGSSGSWEDTMLGGPPPGSADDDEHYVPPEPPPLPRPRKGAFIVLLFFVVGLLLLIAPGLIGLTTTIGTPLGLLALATGLALLLLRVKQGPPDGADPTNGAQV